MFGLCMRLSLLCIGAVLFFACDAFSEENKLDSAEELQVTILPGVDVNVPNQDSVVFLESELNLSDTGNLLVQEKFFVIVTDKGDRNNFSRLINKNIKMYDKEISVNPQILSARHNGDIVPFRTETGIDNVRVFLGKENQRLAPGVHTFDLIYRADNVVKNVNGQKMLIWNVSGNGWKIPVLFTSLSVKHPEKIVPTRQSVLYDNVADLKTANFSDKGDGKSYNFLRKRPIEPGKDLVFAESFRKGDFASSAFSTEDLFDAGIYSAIPALGFLMIFVYYVITWFLCAREKRKIFNPSIGNSNEKFFSPAALRLFLKSASDAKELSVMLIKLALKGFIKIKETEGNVFTFIKQKDYKGGAGLSVGEGLFFVSLFPKKSENSVMLDSALGTRITAKRKIFEIPLLNEFNTQYFKANYSYFLFGLFVISASIVACSAVYDSPILLAMLMTAAVISSLFAVFVFMLLVRTLKGVAGDKKRLKVMVFFIVFVAVVISALFFDKIILSLIGVLPTVFLMLMVITVAVFYNLLKSEKKLGKALSESVRLYKNYLSIGTPVSFSAQKMRELYCKHLPYALVLDLEKEWANRFGAMFDSADKTEFSWYEGDAPAGQSFIADLTERLDAALQNNLAFLNPNLRKFK